VREQIYCNAFENRGAEENRWTEEVGSSRWREKWTCNTHARGDKCTQDCNIVCKHLSIMILTAIDYDFGDFKLLTIHLWCFIVQFISDSGSTSHSYIIRLRWMMASRRSGCGQSRGFSSGVTCCNCRRNLFNSVIMYVPPALRSSVPRIQNRDETLKVTSLHLYHFLSALHALKSKSDRSARKFSYVTRSVDIGCLLAG
jgi:hypothetical protein